MPAGLGEVGAPSVISGLGCFSAIFYAIGNYGHEVVVFRSLVSLPVLPDTMRRTYRDSFNSAIDEGTKTLKIIFRAQ